MANRKRVLPRSFPLTGEDWTEIYYALGAQDGARRKLPVDGLDMTEAKQRRLSERDWIEIYLAIASKLDRLKAGFYGRDRKVREWREHLESILDALDTVREHFIGGKPARARRTSR